MVRSNGGSGRSRYRNAKGCCFGGQLPIEVGFCGVCWQAKNLGQITSIAEFSAQDRGDRLWHIGRQRQRQRSLRTRQSKPVVVTTAWTGGFACYLRAKSSVVVEVEERSSLEEQPSSQHDLSADYQLSHSHSSRSLVLDVLCCSMTGGLIRDNWIGGERRQWKAGVSCR